MSSAATTVVAPRPGWRQRIWRSIVNAFAIVGVLFFVYHTCFHLSVVSSNSMYPTLRGNSLYNGDTVLTERITYRFRKPRRWELVLFLDEFNVQVMKRVVGLPGENVALKDLDTVLINGQPVSKPDSLKTLKYYSYGNLTAGRSTQCGDGWYILGDDSRDSQDSRFTGPLKWDRVRGRPWMVVWPPSRMGFINP